MVSNCINGSLRCDLNYISIKPPPPPKKKLSPNFMVKQGKLRANTEIEFGNYIFPTKQLLNFCTSFMSSYEGYIK
jgi:hypothetical protein